MDTVTEYNKNCPKYKLPTKNTSLRNFINLTFTLTTVNIFTWIELLLVFPPLSGYYRSVCVSKIDQLLTACIERWNLVILARIDI